MDNTPNRDRVRLLHWNINGVRNKSAILHATANEENLDIILLQETLLPSSGSFSFSGYNTFSLPRTDTDRGLLILVKNTIPCSLVSTPIDCGDNVEVQAVKIHLADTTLTCYNIYRHMNGTLNLGELFTQASSEPTFICGDFNAHHPILSSPSHTNEDGEHLAGILEEYPEMALLNNGQATHIAGGRLDLTFLPSALRDRAQWMVHPNLTSDHFAILTTLHLPQLPPPPPPPPKWDQDRANWPQFQNHLSQWHSTYTPPLDADLLWRDLKKAFHEAANASVPLTRAAKSNYADAWYYCSRVKELKHRLNRVRKIHKKRPTTENKNQLREVSQSVHKEIQKIRTAKWLEWCAQLNQYTSLREIWHWLGRATGKHKSKQPTHPNPTAEAETLARHFANRSATQQLPQETQNTQTLLNPTRWQAINQACQEPDSTDLPYSTMELHAVHHKGRDTAPGADRITYTMISQMGQAGEKAFLHLLNTTHAQHTRPREWNQQDTQPIPKPKDKGSYRPIALLSCLEKTAEKMVLNRLKWKTGPLHPNLYAYTDKVGTTECITDVLSFINSSGAIAVFIDLEKAFELASPAAILHSLTLKGTKGHILAWVKNYTLNREARVRFQGEHSTFHTFENGTPQGGILSPFLFNILMENILQIQLPEGVQIFIYADDICVVSRGINKVAKMQRTLNSIARKCNELGLKINSTKTVAMAIKSTTPSNNLQLLGQPINWVKETMYLGVIIDSNLSFNPQIKLLKSKAKLRLAPMKNMATTQKGVGYNILHTYYEATTRSLLDYAAPTLTNLSDKQIQTLEPLQNNAMRLMLGAPMWTRICNLQMETNLPPLQSRIVVRNTTISAKALLSNRDSTFQKRLIQELNRHPDLPTPKTYMGQIGQQIRATGLSHCLSKLKQDKHHLNYTQPPPWSVNPIKFTRASLPTAKQNCSPQTLQAAALNAISAVQTPNSITFYTDGSVDPTSHRAGAAIYANQYQAAWRLSDNCSTLETELTAIKQALSFSLQNEHGPVIIHTDSLSASQALQKPQPKENIHLLTSVLALAQQHQAQGRPITINWIPSHCGIPGNDKADELAKSALISPTINCHLQQGLSQIKSSTKLYSRQQLTAHFRHWVNQLSPSATWYEKATNLIPHPIQPHINRQLAVIIHRLRLGYRCCWEIVENSTRPCQHCSTDTNEPLLHYLLECPTTQPLRSTETITFPTNHPNARAHAASLVCKIVDSFETHTHTLMTHPPPR